ncbi:hypothetical protein F5887DRAFT_1073732 [Amanita rubescens]|nr:hypothetical protein F5887DRAFT_1073732 [Amanita rubescens]
MNGIHCVTFLVCLRWQIHSGHDWKIRRGDTGLWAMIVVTILVFAFSVINLGICLGSFLLAMRGNNNLALAGVLTSLSDALITLESMTADSALTYRCWVVYQKRWPIIVLPVVLLLYNFSTIISVSYWNSLKTVETQISLFTLITQWRPVLIVQEGYVFSTIVINLYATSAIIIQIYRNKRRGHRMRADFTFAIRVIAESGLLYTVAGIGVLAGTLISLLPNGSQLPLIVFGAIYYPLPGIAYDLLLIRVALNRVECRESLTDEIQLTTFGVKSSNAVVEGESGVATL